MSIATQIEALQIDKTAISNAITTKGGTVGVDDGFDDFAVDIMSIPALPLSGTSSGSNLVYFKDCYKAGYSYINFNSSSPYNSKTDANTKFYITPSFSGTVTLRIVLRLGSGVTGVFTPYIDDVVPTGFTPVTLSALTTNFEEHLISVPFEANKKFHFTLDNITSGSIIFQLDTIAIYVSQKTTASENIIEN